jgi:hypothetical protein
MEPRKSMKSCDTPAQANESVPRDAPGLEFPDWSGMLPHRSRMTFEQAVRWNDEMQAMFPPKRKSQKLEAERRCHIEFVL